MRFIFNNDKYELILLQRSSLVLRRGENGRRGKDYMPLKLKPKDILINQDFHDMIVALISAVDAKDPFTAGHSERVAELSLQIAETLNLPQEEKEIIHIAAHLHDIGKIGIDDYVLKKQGQLTANEYNQIKRHPEIGYHILLRVRSLRAVSLIVRHHHERYDGRGYPDGFSGDDIPIGSQIIFLAEAIDAMTSDRPYKQRLILSEALKEIKRCSGSQFDPIIVDAVLSWEDQEIIDP